MDNTYLLYCSNYKGLAYDYGNGYFYRLKQFGQSKVVDRRLIPSEDGNVSYFCFFDKKPVKKKALIIVWEMLQNSLDDDCVLYHKDLDTKNYKASNVGCINRKDYRQFKDALHNVQGGIKLKAADTDAFSHIVSYKKNGTNRKKKCLDIVTALRFKRRLLLISLKILGKYLNTQ